MNIDEPMDLNKTEEANSDQPTAEGSDCYVQLAIEFDSDSMLDPPNESVGDKRDITYDGKVKKEILKVGDGVKRPRKNYLCNISYRCYFFDHQPIEQQDNVTISVSDLSYAEGISNTLVHMRINEIAKIKIKKKMAFGRRNDIDRIRWPQGFEDPESEQGKKIRSKGVIYEVTLNSWVERKNLDGENSAPNYLKTMIRKYENTEWETADNNDEVTLNIKAYVTEDNVLFQRDNWQIKANDNTVPSTLMKVIKSLKRGEHSKVEVDPAAYSLDPMLLSDTIPRLSEYTNSPKLIVECELLKLIKVEDLLKDEGSVIKRVLRKGKGGQPNIDSTVKLRMKIVIDDQILLNNFQIDDILALNLNNLTEEEKQQAKDDPSLYIFTLDEYKLPKLVIKALKGMKRNEVSELIINNPQQHIERLRSNFVNSYFDQYAIFEQSQQKIKITIQLIDTSKEFYFYQLKIAEKLDRVNYLKGIAGQFFKVGNFKKAAKLYQKINGYYNFGDVANNHAKEDETDEYKSKFTEVMAIKVTTFLNLVVCKYKTKEFESIIGITDQIIEMDPNNVKCLYFRGKALIELKEYSKAVDCFTKLVHVDPNHAEGRKELENAKKIKKQYLENEHKKYSKFFN